MARYARIFGFSYLFLYWTVSWNRKQKAKNVRSKISHQPQIPPLKQNKQLIKNKPSKKTCHIPLQSPPKKNNTCPLYMFSDLCSQLMSTTSADFICLKTWAPNHTNVISKPWHFKVLLNVCVSFAVKVVATESYCISMSLMVTHIHSSGKNVEDWKISSSSTVAISSKSVRRWLHRTYKWIPSCDFQVPHFQVPSSAG